MALGEFADIPNFPYPAGTLDAHYVSPKCRFVGRQKGEKTVPENEHYQYSNFHKEIKSPIQLEVVRKE